MKESEITTKTKIDYILTWFMEHPRSTANAGAKILRQKFAHGLRWETVRDLRGKALERRKNTSSAKNSTTTTPTPKMAAKVTLAKKAKAIISIPTPESRLHQAVLHFQSTVRNIKDLTFLGLEVNETGKWSASYEVKHTIEKNIDL